MSSILKTDTMQSLLHRINFGNNRIGVLTHNILDSMHNTNKHERKDLEFSATRSKAIEMHITNPMHLTFSTPHKFKEILHKTPIDTDEESIKIQDTYMNNEKLKNTYKKFIALNLEVLK